METDNDGNEKSVSMLEGDHHGLQFSRVLARERSTSIQSLNSYYQRTEGVVPFEWELMPGTPKNLPEEEMLPPLSPPPSVLSSNLPKPRIDDQLQSHKENWIWRKIKILNKEGRYHVIRSGKKRTIIGDCDPAGSDHDERCKKVGESNGGDLRAFFDCSSTLSSSSTYNPSNSRVMESSNIRRESLHDGPFCCKTPWNITLLVLDEEDKKVYYCREHRTAYTLENSTLSKIMLTSAPSVEEPSFRSYYRSSIAEGVPFEWEKQPGTPIHPPETEVIPPPSPPPAVQSCGLSLPNIRVDEDDDDHDHDTRRRPLISFFGAKSMGMLQNNNSLDGEDKESPGNLWKSKGLSKLSIFSKNPFRAHLCFIPRTLS